MALRFRIPSNRSLADGALYFYPDIFFHDFNKTDYLAQWHAVSAATTSYLVVVDGHLKPAGWIRYYFEQFKGWLGFTNNCAVEKVQMAAKKLAYYGYLNGFNDSAVLATISEWNDEYQPNSDYLQNCAKPRADDTSAALQKQLIEFYFGHGDKLDAMHEPGGCVVFGQSYQVEQDLNMVVQLDIQDEKLIDSILPHLKDSSTILKGSKFCKRYLDYQFEPIIKSFEKLKQKFEKPDTLYARVTSYLTGIPEWSEQDLNELLKLRDQADNALRLFPELKVCYVNILIELNLEIAKGFKAKDASESINAYKQALNLLTQDISAQNIYNEYLSKYFVFVEDHDFHIDSCLKLEKCELAFSLVERLFNHDKEKALDCLERKQEEFRTLVESNPKIRTAFAARNALKGQALLEQGLFHRANKQLAQQCYRKAAALDRNIAVIISPAYYFKEYVDAGKWQEAFDLLQERVTKGLLIDMLPKDSLDRLAQYYIAQASTCYVNATVALTPEDSCRRSIELVKQAIQVVSSDDNLMHLNSYKCRLAKILTEDEDPERINEALDILKEIEKYPSIKRDRHLAGFKELYIRILDTKILLLYHSCLGARIGEYVTAEPPHKARCEETLHHLFQSIDKQISLYDEKKNCQQLAALYFMKAECIDYFELQGDQIACYKKACELEKNQPFYFLRYGEMLPRESQEANVAWECAQGLLESTGFTIQKYIQWFDERWQKEQDKTWNVSMPKPKVQEQVASWGLRLW